MNNYPHIKVPSFLVQDNSKMKLNDAKNYFDWFISVKNERLQILYKYIFKDEIVSFSNTKLNALYYFLKDILVTESLTITDKSDQIDKLPNYLKLSITSPNYKFIEPTFSAIMDLSIYVGEMLIGEVQDLTWDYEKNSKMVDYGYPILVKRHCKIRVCPLWNFQILALQIFENKSNEDRISKLYENWKNAFEGKRKDYSSIFSK